MRIGPGQETASYAISAVRYNEDRTQIVRVRIHAIQPGSVGPPLEVSREPFLTTVELGRGFVTLQRDEGGRYLEQAPVRLIRVNGEIFVRCDAHPWPADHLAGVPEF